MKIFFVNSEDKLGLGYHDKWIDGHVAVTSGDPKYKRKLSKISRRDWVLLYVNGNGVVAVGKILNDIPPKEVKGGERVNRNPNPKDQIEYHRTMVWPLDLRNRPISHAELRGLGVGTPLQAVQQVKQGKKQLLQKIESLLSQQPTSDFEEYVRRASELRRNGPIKEKPAGVQNPIQAKGEAISYSRDPKVRLWILQRADGHCELCGAAAPFLMESEEPYLESHHIVWLAEGGSDTPENTVALCPNCHRELHFGADRKNKSDHLRRVVRNKESNETQAE